MIRISHRADPDSGLMDRITGFARQVDARGFPGIWIGDSLGRGRPTLDSLQVLTALAAVTRRIALGISVLQLPLRNPVELAPSGAIAASDVEQPAGPRRRKIVW
jgi:alkanesulfonate monooxygenase SsuD/methylene tetrahydromethanopterin reductase-like flavin-dependent oxidoreductase (luciferase family)